MKLFAKKLTTYEIDELVLDKVKWVTAATSPVKIILFGSAATGEMTDASDIDFILIYKDDTDLKEMNKILAKARPREDWPQDMLLHTESSFKKSVEKGGGACWIAEQEGKIIYQRSSRK